MLLKHRLFIVTAAILMLAAGIGWADEDSEPPPETKFSIRLTGTPLGYFIYEADTGSGSNYFDSPLHELTLQAEYYLFPQWGIELTIDFKGYAWESMSSGIPFVDFWGVPGFKIGVGAVQHPLDPEGVFDLMIAAGVEFGMFWEDEEYYFGGLGVSARVGIVWKPVRSFGIGLEGAAHIATHFTGETTYYPFTLYEIMAGLVVGFYF